jgi:hypothetical protein
MGGANYTEAICYSGTVTGCRSARLAFPAVFHFAIFGPVVSFYEKVIKVKADVAALLL